MNFILQCLINSDAFKTKLVLVGIFFLMHGYSTGQISGTVFQEFPFDGSTQNTYGVFDANELGVKGVTVTITDAGGAVTTQMTASDGTWNDPVSNFPVRVEFTWPSLPWLESSPDGSGSNTSVQFISSTSSNVDFGLYQPGKYGTSNPEMYTPRYVAGDPLAVGSNSASDAVMVEVPYTADGDRDANTDLATAAEIGSTWGVAYDAKRSVIYAAAFLKRHIGMGPNGPGAIYTIDPSGGSSPSLLVDFVTQGINVGQANIPSNAARNLPADKTLNSYDHAVFNDIAKVSFGDIDISPDQNSLYVVNLFDRLVYQVDLNSPTSITALPAFPNPSCTNGVARPFGLEICKGKLLLGVVCSAENGGSFANLDGYIYSYDLSSGSWDASPMFTFDLDYPRGALHFNTVAPFQPWEDVFTNFLDQGEDTGNTSDNFGRAMHPQPIISDIETDSEGSLHIGIMDRAGHQLGHRNSDPDPTETSARLMTGMTAGDLLRTYLDPNTGNLVLENAGVAGPYTSSGTGTDPSGPGSTTSSSGPGNGEFYWSDFVTNFDVVNNVLQEYHSETFVGGLSHNLGSNDLPATVFDPTINQLDAGGIQTFDITDGDDTRDYTVYFDASTDASTSGKANGLGDIELLSSLPPIEIGNYVWEDTDMDGIQDPDENPISGLTVELYDASGTTLLATATTDGNGNYIFSNDPNGSSTGSHIYNISQLEPDMSYLLRFPTMSGALDLTSANSGSVDIIDSDANASGEITVQTSDIPVFGANNHSFDVGYSMSNDCPPNEHVICDNDSNVADLIAAAGLTNIVWYEYNEQTMTAGAIVGTGQVLTITGSDIGTAGSRKCYVYTADDAQGCPAELCCPVCVSTEQCCPDPNCYNVNITVPTDQ